jgi:hypothetical protein
MVRWGTSLRDMRELAGKTAAAGINGEALMTARVSNVCEVFHSFSADEKLLACCLCCHPGHFPMASLWAMSKDAYNGDVVRFKLAWDYLVEIEWIIQTPELGYKLSSLAQLIFATNSALEQQFLFDNYVIFWTSELIRINKAGAEIPSAMDEFNRYCAHFRYVFNNILSYEADSRSSIADYVNSHKKVLKTKAKLSSHPSWYHKDHQGDEKNEHRGKDSKMGTDSPRLLERNSSEHDRSMHASPRSLVSAAPSSARQLIHQSSRKRLHQSLSSTHVHYPDKAQHQDERGTHERDSDRSGYHRSGSHNALLERRGSVNAQLRSDDDDFDREAKLNDEEATTNENAAYALTRHISRKFSILSDSSCTTTANDAEWTCYKAQPHDFTTTDASTNIMQIVVEMLAGNVGRLLMYHMPKLIGLKIAEQIVRHLNPTDHSGCYEAALVDLSEQCLRNNLIDIGLECINLVVNMFYSTGDSDFHDPPYYAARALIIQGRLITEQDKKIGESSHAHAIRAFEAADRILQLEGWLLTDHHERRLCIHLKNESESASAAVGAGVGGGSVGSTVASAGAKETAGAKDEERVSGKDEKNKRPTTWGVFKSLVTATKK